MVQCDKQSTKAASGNGASYAKPAEKKTPSYQQTMQKSSAKEANSNGSWGQFKNESHFKSLHHC